jgi:hypothetical protein
MITHDLTSGAVVDASSIVALSAAGISALAALVSAWLAAHTVRSERVAAADEIASRFREPLLQAAFNLQTRIYNIVNMGFLQVFASGSRPDDERDYAYENTLYLLGQYFCWVEVVRRESQFLDPRSRARNRDVTRQLERVRDAFASSEQPEILLRIFRGQQRAIGEVMLDPTESAVAGLPRWDCLGYAAFVEKREDQHLQRWFRRPRCDLSVLQSESARTARLVDVQHALLELIRTLDPSAERVSATMLTPLEKGTAPERPPGTP